MLLGKIECNPVSLPMPNPQTSGIILFVKAPQVGLVKTRLGKTIGLQQSCELYRQFGLDLLQRLNTLNLPLLIFFAPLEGLTLVQGWLGDHQFFPQQGQTLGDRMAQAFQTGFQLGFQQLLILGSDSPDVPLSFLQQGMEALKQDYAVIGPSHDGGYYSLGFSQTSWCPKVFDNIPWSSESVYSDSLEILRSHPAPVKILPSWYDVDTLDDLQNFYQRNQTQRDLPRSLDYLNQTLAQYLVPIT
jgi:rSAM/selenodomain-associated transferase 1